MEDKIKTKQLINCSIRSDKQGDGHFGAPRGQRTHNGIDFVIQPKDKFKFLFDGNVTKLGYAYSKEQGKEDQRYIEVTSVIKKAGEYVTYVVRYLYVDVKNFKVSQKVTTKDTIITGNIAGRYNDNKSSEQKMINHVHVEIRAKQHSKINNLITPVPYINPVHFI